MEVMSWTGESSTRLRVLQVPPPQPYTWQPTKYPSLPQRWPTPPNISMVSSSSGDASPIRNYDHCGVARRALRKCVGCALVGYCSKECRKAARPEDECETLSNLDLVTLLISVCSYFRTASQSIDPKAGTQSSTGKMETRFTSRNQPKASSVASQTRTHSYTQSTTS